MFNMDTDVTFCLLLAFQAKKILLEVEIEALVR